MDVGRAFTIDDAHAYIKAIFPKDMNPVNDEQRNVEIISFVTERLRQVKGKANVYLSLVPRCPQMR